MEHAENILSDGAIDLWLIFDFKHWITLSHFFNSIFFLGRLRWHLADVIGHAEADFQINKID